MKISIPYVLTVITAVVLIIIGYNFVAEGRRFNLYDNAAKPEVTSATVLEVSERIIEEDEFIDDEFGGIDHFFTGEKIYFEAKIRGGKHKGEIVRASQTFSNYTPDMSKEVEKGDLVSLIKFEKDWLFNGYYRIGKIIGLGFIFMICVIIFGRKKGFNTLLSLFLTCVAIFAVFVPSILAGKNIYLMSILVCMYTTAMTLLIVIGYNKKSFAAAVGCISGILVTGLIILIMDKVMLLTGIVDEHSRYLAHLPVNPPINLRAIIFAGIIIGTVGAVMDVSMSIASSLWEVKEKAQTISFKSLFRSGLTIGRDIFGATAYTLILAYIGSALSVVLVLSVYSSSLPSLLNMEMIIVEILQILAGGLGILFAMPLTAFFCSTIYLKKL
jgi:uncharacterized membrane protein